MNKCIIFDIDGTVADLSHRVHHVQGKRKDWVAFMATLSADKPIEQTITLNQMMSMYLGAGVADHKTAMPIYLASGRSEDERKDTEDWLYKHGVYYDRLFMRKSKDYRADHVVKKEILDEIRAIGYEPWLVIDDRQQVVDMWRSEGIFVLQCDPKANFTAHLDYEFHESIKYPLTIMVGPSGAGKSLWTLNQVECYGIDPASVISSDIIRHHLCGDFQDQSKNQEVFETMHELASLRLKRGLPVILDATHLRNADRIKAAKIVPDDVPVKYVVINRPIADKKASGGWRNSVNVKGKSLIDFHDQVFRSNLKDILNGDGLPNVTVVEEVR